MNHRPIETLLDLLDDAVARFGDRPAFAIRRDDDTTETWTYRELDRRTRVAAFRLRALGLAPGHRVLTWSPSTPELPAAYFGAMRAGIVYVPLDLRMSKDAVAGIAAAAGATHLIAGTGRDMPDPAEFGLAAFPTTNVEYIGAPPDGDTTLPGDWAAQVDGWPRPQPEDIVQLVFTSGTTGTPKGVMLAHDNLLAANRSFHNIVPPMEHRIVSLLPL
ncbi:MAG TPA: class I adenylate-forming enzyme family protein, partial [Candidatus Limnocylindrales bacterium]|nr:class I adenylate-forming enzyme family protein [Candidatus Limnocylindrales bacterium]